MPLSVQWDEVESEWHTCRDLQIREENKWDFLTFVKCWRFWQWVQVGCQHCHKWQDITIVADRPVLTDRCYHCGKPAEDQIWFEAVVGAARQRSLQGVKTLLGG